MSLRIVVLEDDVAVRGALRATLTDDEYVVVFARNSRELMRLLRSSWAPCIVLLDPLAWSGPIEVLMERVQELRIPLAVLPIGLTGQASGHRPARRLIHPESVRTVVRCHCGGSSEKELLPSKVRIPGRP